MSIFNGLEYADKANQAPETVIDKGSNDLTEVSRSGSSSVKIRLLICNYN